MLRNLSDGQSKYISSDPMRNLAYNLYSKSIIRGEGWPWTSKRKSDFPNLTADMRRFLPSQRRYISFLGNFALAQEDGTENDSKDRELVLGPERQESKDERKDSTLNRPFQQVMNSLGPLFFTYPSS